MTLLAQGADTASVLVQYGALGVLTLLALGAVRVLFQRETKALDLERERANELQRELNRLNNTIQEKFVPALERSSQMMERALKLVARRDDER